MRLKVLVVASASATLFSCGRAPSLNTHSPDVIEAAWNGGVASRIRSLGDKFKYTLPELRIYDAHRALIFRQIGDAPTIDDAVLNRVIAADRPTAGPTFGETVGDLDTADHHPVAARLPASQGVTIFDYWADWCASCKVLGKRLSTWAAIQPQGVVRIVKAEADVNKLLGQASPSGGDTVVRKVIGADGKLHTVTTRTVKTTTYSH